MDNKKKPTAKGYQKVSKFYSIDEVKALIKNKEEKILIQYKDELTKKINCIVNQIGSQEISVSERAKYAEQYEETEEILFLILESFNTQESIEKADRLRSFTYDINRRAIMVELNRHVTENNRFPSQTEISTQTGLSRKTVRKHLNELSTNKDYEDLRNSSSILLPVIMAQVYKLAMNGDVRAMKTFLDFHRQGPTTTFIKNQQNNYDQTEPLEIKIVSTGVEMKTMEG
jgi:Helix-turn-helix domain